MEWNIIQEALGISTLIVFMMDIMVNMAKDIFQGMIMIMILCFPSIQEVTLRLLCCSMEVMDLEN